MSIDEILNGRFEQEAREALAKMQAACPPGHVPQVVAHIGGHSFIGVGYNEDKTGNTLASTYTGASLTDMADKCIALATGPEAVAKRRQELTAKAQAIQAELDALPEPAPAEPTIVPEPAAAA